MMKAPAVFVSSTIHNIKQIRADLKDFITQMGLFQLFLSTILFQ